MSGSSTDRLAGRLGPLRERDFRLYFTARTISAFGGTMATVALAFAVLDLSGPRDLGLVIVAREIPTTGSDPWRSTRWGTC